MNKLTKRIQPYIDALFPILYINTYEELTVQEVINDLAIDKKVYEWDNVKKAEQSLEEFLALLAEEMIDNIERIIVLKNTHTFLDEPKIVALLKRIAQLILEHDIVYANVIIISPILTIPKELEKLITVFEVDLPNFDKKIIEIIQAYEKSTYNYTLEKKRERYYSYRFTRLISYRNKKKNFWI